MIGPKQRVRKPARKSRCDIAAATMGKRRRRSHGPYEQHYRYDSNFILRASPLFGAVASFPGDLECSTLPAPRAQG